MNSILKIAVVVSALLWMLIPGPCYGQAGHMHRATRRRTAVVVSSATSSSASSQTAAAQQQTAAANQQAAAANQKAATAEQQTAAAQKQAATAEKEAAAAKQQAASASAAANSAVIPIGTVVPALPGGCSPKTINNQAYYECGVNHYRAVFQGSNLVYVTAKP